MLGHYAGQWNIKTMPYWKISDQIFSGWEYIKHRFETLIHIPVISRVTDLLGHGLSEKCVKVKQALSA